MGLILGVNIYQPLDKFICGIYDVSPAGFCGVLKIKYIYFSDKKKKPGDENKMSRFRRSELPQFKTRYHFHLQNARSTYRSTVNSSALSPPRLQTYKRTKPSTFKWTFLASVELNPL
jgi:hypothetical protein